MSSRGKYFVARIDKETLPGRRHANCHFLVIDLSCDPWARAVVEAILKVEPRGEYADMLRKWLMKGELPIEIKHVSLAEAGLAVKPEDKPKPIKRTKPARDPRTPKSQLQVWKDESEADDELE